ncbi:hypothetical protein OsI_00567 [Oryza sativa Indica Group]|uniref:LOB domain-containing protein n=1 Tax=Oryza sativa subsp. indica TaxID=39946 RepID=A2WL54_ORYSI|nr:hypothetical protein OsI_00567 [Oryza sativa Indica Group]
MASSSSTSNSAISSVVASAVATTTPGAGSPCAACKFLRRKCLPGCVFAPYFPPEEPQKFANVHKVFGASNVTKLLNELLPHQREDARQVHRLQKELDTAHAELLRYACGEVGIPTALPVTAAPRLAAAMPAPGQLAAAVSAGMYGGGRRLGVIDGGGIAPPSPHTAGCYYARNNNNAGRIGADVAPVLPYASVANWTVNAISTTTTNSGSESIGMDHKEGGDSSM